MSEANASAYARLRFPILIIRGEHAPLPTRLIADSLSSLLPAARLTVVAGAGHMGPLTHSAEVNALIVRHVVKTKGRAVAPWRESGCLEPGSRLATLPGSYSHMDSCFGRATKQRVESCPPDTEGDPQ